MGETAIEIYAARVETPFGLSDLLTVLPLELISLHGLIPECVIGKLDGPITDEPEVTTDTFLANPAFIAFMHDLIARHAPNVEALKEEAKRQGTGWLYICDRRCRTADGSVPPHDIIGCFKVENGAVLSDSYTGNDKHAILSPDGFFQLDEELHKKLVEELTIKLIEADKARSEPQ